MKQKNIDTREILSLKKYNELLKEATIVCPQCGRSMPKPRAYDPERIYFRSAEGYFCHRDCASIYANNIITQSMGTEFNKVKI